jgi:hypothetical protein
MTRLKPGQRLKREVQDVRRGDLVITLADEGIFMRHKGKRTTYGPISYGLVMLQGEKMAALVLRRERAEKKKLRSLVKRGR